MSYVKEKFNLTNLKSEKKVICMNKLPYVTLYCHIKDRAGKFTKHEMHICSRHILIY